LDPLDKPEDDDKRLMVVDTQGGQGPSSDVMLPA